MCVLGCKNRLFFEIEDGSVGKWNLFYETSFNG